VWRAARSGATDRQGIVDVDNLPVVADLGVVHELLGGGEQPVGGVVLVEYRDPFSQWPGAVGGIDQVDQRAAVDIAQ